MKNLFLLVLSFLSIGISSIKAQNTSDCSCFALYSPVCGVDGITYSNYCEAECEDVAVESEGTCLEIETIVDANVGETFTYEHNLGPNESPFDGPILSLSFSPDWADAFISIDYSNNSQAFGSYVLSVTGAPSIEDLGQNYFIIQAQAAFSDTYYAYDTLIVNVLPVSDCICPAVAIPVCGVDGNTYGNNCLAACENIDIAYSGACITDTGCIGEFEISSQEYIAGFAGMILHLQVQNTGNDLDFAFASLILENTCFSNDQFSIENWASNTSQDLYFNYSCLSMAPYIEPFEAALILSGNTNCADEINFEFDPQGPVSPQGCTADNGVYYENGASWNLDDCTFCSCENGEIFCAVADCAAPTCENPIYQEGQCCPICEEEELIYGCTDPSADNYYANALFDDGSCIYSNLLSCTYMGAIYALGASVTIVDETCTCEFNVEFDIINSVEMNCISTIDTMGCTSNDGEFYPLGSSINSECETCTCVGSLLTIYPPEPPMWSCSEIADCVGEECECPLNYEPVCGSNGITYSNACFAECEVSDYYEGDCLPTSFCELLSVETETNYSADGQVILTVTVFNNSTNNINYPVFGFGNTNEELVIEPQFENAYWIGAGESTSNSYLLSGGNEAVTVEEVYYVSQLNQNSACPFPIEFVYNPPTNSEYCYSDGEPFTIGSTFTDECEMCICTGSDAASLTEPPTWLCEPIDGCEENPCYLIDCAPGYDCINGDCIVTEPQEYGCELEGDIYAFGATTEQGCNECYCMAGFNPNANGIWSCTEMACSGCTDPDASNYDPYATVDNQSCEYENTAPDWTFPNTGVNHTLILAEEMLVNLNGANLEPGDWIGVFYPLNNELICGGYTVWEGNTTVIPAQGDDTTTDMQNGFTANQEFQWLVWDASANTIFSMDATYDQGMASQELYTNNGISAIETLSAQTLITQQQIQLSEGWNMFSTYMTQESMDIETLFLPYQDAIVIVKNFLGQAYLPNFNFNGIGNFIPGQGYQAKLTDGIELNIEGTYIRPEETPINLLNGWNLIAYLRTEPADVVSVFEEIEDLVVVKNNSGMAYLPEFDFNGIGNMEATEAYQVKVLMAQQLEYLPNNQTYRLGEMAVQNNLQHYKKPLNTGANMSLVLKKEQLENQLQYGDEIGVYSSTNNLVGAFVYKGKTVVIPVYGNDEYSERQDGLLNNEALNLRYWSIKTKEEIKLASDWEQATVLYQQNSIQEFTIASPTENSNQVEFRIQPNPAKHSTILNFFLAESTVISLQLYDLMGKLIFEQNTLEFGKGKNSYTLKLDAFSAGTYLLKIQTNIAVYTKQLQMN